MTTYGLPILYALFVWWFSTGAVLFVIGLPRATFRWSMGAATAIALAAIYVLWQMGGETTATSAYVAFTCALLVWGWHEMSFLTGLVTGPRTTECPPRTSSRAPLLPAIETLIYHELAILVTGIVLYALLAGSDNPLGWWTYAILWIMRLSAKFNVYLGVPNLTEEFLPKHLRYLKSYFCHRAMNLLFPLSVTLTTIGTALLVQAATAPGVTEFEATTYTFLATLLGLALLEHWFLVIPLPAAALWSWGLTSRDYHPGVHTAGKDHRHDRRDRDDIKAADPITAVA